MPIYYFNSGYWETFVQKRVCFHNNVKEHSMMFTQCRIPSNLRRKKLNEYIKITALLGFKAKKEMIFDRSQQNLKHCIYIIYMVPLKPKGVSLE